MEEKKSDIPDLMESLNSVYNILNKDVTCKSDEVNLVLFLMKKLPPCREPALEVLKNVLLKCLDEMVRRNNIKDDPEVINLTKLVNEIETTLSGLIDSEPSFSFTLAEWSIERLVLLGVETGLTGPLTNFAPVQLYINTLSKSLKNISKEQLKSCLDRLLNTPSNNAIHFEWVVAQISASFPKEMIARVLQFGLKDYYNNTSAPRLGRVASVLTHLIHSNALLVYRSLTDFLKESLDSSNAEESQTALFFLHLSCQSTLLFRILISIFFKLVDWSMLKQIITKVQSKTRINSQQLNDLMVAVLLSCDHMAVELLDCLLCLACSDFNAFSEHIEVDRRRQSEVKMEDKMEVEKYTSAFCCRLINNLVVRMSSLTVNDMNLSNSLNNNLVSFSKLFKPPFNRQQMSFKLMRSFCQLYPTSSCHLLCLILSQCSSNKEIAIFKQLQTEVSHTNATIAHDVMAEVVDTLEDQSQDERFKSVSLLHQLFLVEEENVFQCVRLKSELDHFYCRLVNLIFLPSTTRLTKPSPQAKNIKNGCSTDKVATIADSPGSIFYAYNHALLRLIASAEKEDKGFENQAELLHTSSLIINLLFASLKHLNGTEKISLVRLVVGRLKWLCEHGCQQFFITTLFHEALSEKHDLFSRGHKRTKNFKELSSIVPLFTDTFNTNNITTSDAKSHGLLFHTGSIGDSERNHKTKNPNGLVCGMEGMEDSTLLNKFLFLNAFQLCCLSSKDEASMDGLMDKKVVEGLSDCVLDACMPDSLTSGVLWNQEDAINYSRDLLVKKKFLDTELLRKMLDILSASQSGIWRCGAVLRGLLGHVLTYWESCREGAEDKQQLQLTIDIITLLNEGALLPEPLSLVGELLQHVSSYEVFLLLFEVWTFLKENNPTPNSTAKCDSKHIEAVRMIMINNIHNCGHLFPFFFK